MGNSIQYTIEKEDLSDYEYDFLLESTNFNREEIKSMYKKYLKICSFGGISKETFKEIYGDLFPAKDSERLSENLFRVFDKNQSGKISFKELLIGINLSSENEPIKKLNWLFQIFDVNGNGKIEAKELKEILKGMYGALGVDCDKRVDQYSIILMEKMDSHKTGFISKEEFVEACLADQELYNLLTYLIVMKA